jgi:MSHA biogenesis protein MshM
MLKANFGIEHEPFLAKKLTLLPQQQEIYDVLHAQSYHGGLSLILGEPGTGKSTLKDYIIRAADPKHSLVATVGRTLHTYSNTMRILCDAFGVETRGASFTCEKNVLTNARTLQKKGITLITIIDDAHLLPMPQLRKLRLLFEEFPPNHNLILIGQLDLLHTLLLGVNEDLRSRVTYSAVLKRLTREHIEHYILAQLDACGLGHNVFDPAALELITRNADGLLRSARNMCLSCFLVAARKNKQHIDTTIVNTVLLQPHWRQADNL